MAIQPLLQLAPDDTVTAANEPRHVDPEAAIGEQLRELRQVKNLTLREVAEKVGISVSYLSQLERNQSRLPIGVLKKISDAEDNEISIDVTDIMQRAHDAGSFHGFMLISANEDSSVNTIEFCSDDHGTGAAQPELVLVCETA